MTDVPERFRLWLKRTPDGKFIPTKLSNERAAVEAVLGTGACSVTWLESVRRGESGEEPDWVSTDPAGVIVAGFEVTEPAFTASRLVNAKLAEWLAGQAPPPDRARMPSHEHAERAWEIVKDAERSLQQLQGCLEALSPDELAKYITDCIEKKKQKSYYKSALYPLHLIIHESGWYYVDGPLEEALAKASQHDCGKFAAVWYVDQDNNVTKLHPRDQFQIFTSKGVERRRQRRNPMKT